MKNGNDCGSGSRAGCWACGSGGVAVASSFSTAGAVTVLLAVVVFDAGFSSLPFVVSAAAAGKACLTSFRVSIVATSTCVCCGMGAMVSFDFKKKQLSKYDNSSDFRCDAGLQRTRKRSTPAHPH